MNINSGDRSNSTNGGINTNIDGSYYNLVESYLTTTREILNGFMTFERGLIRIINNRIIFRYPIAELQAATATAPTMAPAPTTAPAPPTAPATATAPTTAPATAPATIPTTQPTRTSSFLFQIPPPPPPRVFPRQIQQPQPPQLQPPLTTTSPFVQYRLPVPSTRLTTAPLSPMQSPPPIPPLQSLQSLSPILPISSRIRRDDLIHLEPNNNNIINTQPSASSDSLIYFTQIINRELTRDLHRDFINRELNFNESHEARESRTFQSRQNTNNSNNNYDRIQMATKLIPFCTIVDPINEVCPISQIQFEEIDCIMQINACKHNFNPYSLFRWFETHSTCPMCRHDLNHSDYDNDSDTSEYD